MILWKIETILLSIVTLCNLLCLLSKTFRFLWKKKNINHKIESKRKKKEINNKNVSEKRITDDKRDAKESEHERVEK